MRRGKKSAAALIPEAARAIKQMDVPIRVAEQIVAANSEIFSPPGICSTDYCICARKYNRYK